MPIERQGAWRARQGSADAREGERRRQERAARAGPGAGPIVDDVAWWRADVGRRAPAAPAAAEPPPAASGPP